MQEVSRKVGDLASPFHTVEFYASAYEVVKSDSFKSLQRKSVTTNEALSPSNKFVAKAKARAKQVPQFAKDSAKMQELLSQYALSAYRSDLTVEMTGGLAKFTLNLTPPFDAGLEILDSGLIHRKMYVVCEWGYSNASGTALNSSGKYLFQTVSPSFQFSEADITITMTGWDLFTARSTRGERNTTWPRTGAYKQDVGIVKALIADMGMLIDEQDIYVPKTFDVFAGKEAHSLYLDKNTPREQKGQTDWLFFKSIMRETGCTYRISDGNRVMIFDTNTAAKRSPSYRFLCYKNTSPAKCGAYDVPLLSFGSQILGSLFFPPSSFSVVLKKADLKTGETDTKKTDMSKEGKEARDKGTTGAGEVEETTSTNTSMGAVKGQPPTVRDGRKGLPAGNSKLQGGKMVSAPSRDEDAEEAVRQDAVRGAGLANTRAEATVPGIPKLSPFDIVLVEGLGKTLSGGYLVTGVTHTLGEGYECQVKLLRKTLNRDPEPGESVSPGLQVDTAKKGACGASEMRPTNLKDQ